MKKKIYLIKVTNNGPYYDSWEETCFYLENKLEAEFLVKKLNEKMEEFYTKAFNKQWEENSKDEFPSFFETREGEKYLKFLKRQKLVSTTEQYVPQCRLSVYLAEVTGR